MTKTTIYLPDKLHEAAIAAEINISATCRRAIEFEIYGDNPKFIEFKIKEAKKRKQQTDEEIIQLEKKLEKANKQYQQRKKQLPTTKPEVQTYGVIKTKKQGDGK